MKDIEHLEGYYIVDKFGRVTGPYANRIATLDMAKESDAEEEDNAPHLVMRLTGEVQPHV